MSSQSPPLIPEQGKPSIFADFFNSSAEANLELRGLIIFVSHSTSLSSGLIQAIFFPLLDKGQAKEQKNGLLLINLTLKKGHRKSTAFLLFGSQAGKAVALLLAENILVP